MNSSKISFSDWKLYLNFRGVWILIHPTTGGLYEICLTNKLIIFLQNDTKLSIKVFLPSLKIPF